MTRGHSGPPTVRDTLGAPVIEPDPIFAAIEARFANFSSRVGTGALH
jgi:hypothetical protein